MSALHVKGLLWLGVIMVFHSCQTESEENEIIMNDSSARGAFILPDVHDPSQLVFKDNKYHFVASGLESWYLEEGASNWTFAGEPLDENKPSWYNGTNRFWAPALIESDLGDLWTYFSAVEDEDSHQSKIGFGTLIDASDDILLENEQTYVLSSQSITDAFAIDPSVFRAKDEGMWLVFGSHGAGIYTVELNPSTGYLKETPSEKAFDSTDSRFFHIADYGGGLTENNVEAAYIFNHPTNDYYYLFVNWDVCCNGVNSTYNIRVGRSQNPEGPYLDKEGNNMASGGGSLFIDSSGEILDDSRFIGPGHSGICQKADGSFIFSHHFYDGNNEGMPSMAFWSLGWEQDWPVIQTTEPLLFW